MWLSEVWNDIFHLMISIERIWFPRRGKYFSKMWNLKTHFFSGMRAFVSETADKYPHLPHVKICQSIWIPLIFFPLLLILRGLRGDPEKTFWNGPELAVWLFGNPLLFLSLFYNLIKSALCFATFQALISGLGRVKRPRQFEKGSLHHKEAACSQSFPSSTPPRQKKRGREQKGHSLARYRENLMKVL